MNFDKLYFITRVYNTKYIYTIVKFKLLYSDLLIYNLFLL